MNLKTTFNSIIENMKTLGSSKKAIAAMSIAMVAIVGGITVGATLDQSPEQTEKAKLADNPESIYSIMVNGTHIAGLSSETEANQVLDQVKNHYVTEGAELLEVNFVDEVVVTPAAVEASNLEALGVDEAVTLILTGEKEPKTYVVQGGDTVWDIAMANDLSPYELMEMNPGVEDKVSIGQTLNLYQIKPFVTIQTKEVVTAEEKIEYQVQYENTSNLYKGQSQVKMAGSFGSKTVKSEVVKENGNVVSSLVLEEQIITEPITQVTIVGTKTIPVQTGTGQLGVPVTNIEISSAYGSRGGGRHYGVDLRMPKGSAIMAADSGTVTKAAYSGSYGNLIIISHGGGLETYYSHCNTINVTLGQNVTKGDVIATVGATGNATGNHLHFEVRLNGTPQNPMSYL